MIGKLSSQIFMDIIGRATRNRSSISGSIIRSNSSKLSDERFISSIKSQIRAQERESTSLLSATSYAQSTKIDVEALSKISTQLKDIALSGANDDLSFSERENLAAEASSLIEEFDRLSSAARLGSTNLLNGSFGVGSGSEFAISFDKISSKRLGGVARVSNSQNSFTLGLTKGSGAQLSINGYTVGTTTKDGVSSSLADDYSAVAFANSINAISDKTGVEARVKPTTRVLYLNADAKGTGYAGTFGVGDFQLNGVSIAGTIELAEDLVSAINKKSSETGVTASYDSASGRAELVAADGRNIELRLTNNSGNDAFEFVNRNENTNGLTGWLKPDLLRGESITGTIHRVSTGAIELVSNEAFSLKGAGKYLGIDDGTYETEGGSYLSNLDFSTKEASAQSLDIVNAAIEQIEKLESKVEILNTRLDVRSAAVASSVGSLESFTRSFESNRKALEVSEALSKQIQADQRSASYYHRSLNAFRATSIINNWLQRS